MTISSQTRKAGPYAGNNVADTFQFQFKVFVAADVLVVHTNSQGAESVLVSGTDYTVNLSPNQDALPGGDVVLTAPLPTGEKLTITSAVPQLQTLDLTNQGGFYPATINAALDRSTILVQQVAEQVGRAVKVQISSNVQPDQLIDQLTADAAAAHGDALAAAQSASDALTSEGNANTAAQLAADWATKLGSTVDGSEYSAKQYAQDAAASTQYLPAGTGAVATTVQSKLRETVSVKDFGAKGDGVTDDTAAIVAAVSYIKTNGGTLFFPAGIYITQAIQTGGGTKTWAMVGEGKDVTTIKAKTGAGSLINGAASSVGYTIKGFTIDNQFSVYADANARQGIAILNTNDVTVEDLFVTDYKNSAILIYSDTPNVYSNGRMINCSCDGLGVGTNGFLFADMDDCHYIGCTAKNVVFAGVGGPGVGVQFKNNCRYGSAVDCYSENCFVGFGFAGDTVGAVQGPAYNTLSNFRCFNCFTGIRAGNRSEANTITNVVIDHNNQNSSDPIDIQENAAYNSLTNIVALNIGSSRRGVFFRTGATDNYVEFGHLANMNTSALAAFFGTTSLRNRVSLRRQSNPTVLSGGVKTMAIFADVAANGNSFTYDSYVPTESRTITAGVIVLRNASTQSLLMDTEGGAATDDLDTITTFGVVQQVIYIQTINDARDVVVKHNTGNIRLAGAADVTLPNRRSYIALTYNEFSSVWIELYRSINP